MLYNVPRDYYLTSIGVYGIHIGFNTDDAVKFIFILCPTVLAFEGHRINLTPTAFTYVLFHGLPPSTFAMCIVSLDCKDTLYQSTVASGFHPAGTTWRDIDNHELGHVAMHAVGQKMYTDPKEFKRRWNNGTLPARVVHEAYQEILSAPNSYGFRGKVPTEAKLREAVSRYATKNYHETIAEAWTDYHANKNASKALSRAIMTVMERYK